MKKNKAESCYICRKYHTQLFTTSYSLRWRPKRQQKTIFISYGLFGGSASLCVIDLLRGNRYCFGPIGTWETLFAPFAFVVA